MDYFKTLALLLLGLTFISNVSGECPPYDPSVYICCNDVLNPRPPNAMCCQTKAVNTQTHQCCNGVINPRPEGDARCCQHQSFNAETHMCCEGTINPRACGNVTCCKFVGFCTDTHRCCPDNPAVVPIGLPCPPLVLSNDQNIRPAVGQEVLSNDQNIRPAVDQEVLSNDQDIPPAVDQEVKRKKKTHRSSLKHKGKKHYP